MNDETDAAVIVRLTKELLEARAEIERQKETIRLHCSDWAEDHTHAQTVAKHLGIPDAQVEGDSYGVPGIQELVDMIAAKVPIIPDK